MKWFNRKNTIEEMATNQEQRFVIEVGHNRNNELIIKKLRVSGDDLETCITDLQSALQDFHILKVAQLKVMNHENGSNEMTYGAVYRRVGGPSIHFYFWGL